MPHTFRHPICLDAPCMFGHPMFGHPHNWMPPVCLDTPYVQMPLYVWTPPVWTPPYVWMPIHLDIPCMFGHLPYVWTHPVCLDAPYVWTLPICLDAPCMFGHPHMFGHPLYVLMPQYVWTTPICLDAPYVLIPLFGCLHMFGCPLYIHNTKKACFVRLRGCPYPPYICTPPCIIEHPHIFRCPQMYVASKGMGEHPSIQGVSKHGGIQTYRGCPNIQGQHPNIEGVSKYMGSIQTYREHMNIGSIWTPPRSDNPPCLSLK